MGISAGHSHLGTHTSMQIGVPAHVALQAEPHSVYSMLEMQRIGGAGGSGWLGG